MMEEARQLDLYPKCWDCAFYSSGEPLKKELESCKHPVWYLPDGKVTAFRFMKMLDQMADSHSCPYCHQCR